MVLHQFPLGNVWCNHSIYSTERFIKNGSIFTFVNDCICDIRFVYGKVNDKLQFIDDNYKKNINFLKITVEIESRNQFIEEIKKVI